MSRRAVTLLVAAVGVVIALAVAAFAPVPYVALVPGPTLNTLGTLNGKPMIQVTGHQTYQAKGNLNMVTVSFIGGPHTAFNIFAALRSWLNHDDAVVPQTEIFPAGQTSQQVARQDTEEMANSQETATAAALCQLRISFRTVDTIEATVKGMPAAGVLRAGDVISAVDGKPVTCNADASTLIKARTPGSPVELTILRHGSPQNVRLNTVSAGGEPEIGVEVVESYVFPFNVSITVGDIGGPSAGLMFALGIIDKITPDNLAGSRFIAGTGEIEANGTVDPIGGIQQKMVGARQAGATIFLAPAANCPDTAGAIPAGMRVIKVYSLAGAMAELNALKAGKPVPSC
jgi:Lon-like protease